MHKYKFRLILIFGLFTLNFLYLRFCFAGGGEYDFPDDTGEAGPAYFGLVRDDRGWNLPSTKAILTTKNGIKVEVKTNVLGLYRTHISKSVKAEDVTVSCQKEGYTQLKLVNRGSSNRYVETDCILKKLQ